MSKRINVIVGHFGSGKTEFAVNYALKMAESSTGLLPGHLALIDLDIANPYFRSREKQALLEANGIDVYSNTFGFDITADLPAITARINGPLQNPDCSVIIDAGGDDSGARILKQFIKYFSPESCDVFCVINANRPKTRGLDGALEQIRAIEEETGLKITGLVNNTHLLRETTLDDLIKGCRLCEELSVSLSVPIRYNCINEKIYSDFVDCSKLCPERFGACGEPFLMEIRMRQPWQDR